MNAEACLKSLDALLKEHVGDKDDVISMIRQDDVDSLNTYLAANELSPDQCESGMDQGLLHLAAEYDAVNILHFLLNQYADRLKEGTLSYDPIAVAYEHRSIRTLLLFLQREPSGSVANYLMSRLSLFDPSHLEYDSLLYLPASSPPSGSDKSFSRNLAQFNEAYRHIQFFAVNQKRCLFVDGHSAFIGNPRLDALSIHPISLAEPILSASLGTHHALLLTQSGHVYGAGSDGVLQGRLQYLDGPMHFSLIPGLSSVTQVLCGASHSLALTAAGDLFGWGENARGQLLGGSSLVAAPQRLASRVSLAALHGDHSAYACPDGVFFFPSYRHATNASSASSATNSSSASNTSRPTRVNTLYFLQLRVAQLACHDGFDTLLTTQGQLFAYFYLDARGERSPAARALFPASLDPGCIFALLPSRVVCRVFPAPSGCVAQTEEGQMFFLGARKSMTLSAMGADGRLDALGGHVEVLAVDAQRGAYCRLLRRVAPPRSASSLVAMCAEGLRRSLPLRGLLRAASLARKRGSGVLMAVVTEAVLNNIAELLFFFPSLLQEVASIILPLSVALLHPSESTSSVSSTHSMLSMQRTQASGESMQEAHGADEVLERVFRRARALRKRIEKANQAVVGLKTHALRLDDAMAVVARQELMEELAQYVRVATELRRTGWEASGEVLRHLEWLCAQTLGVAAAPSSAPVASAEGKAEGAVKKKKKGKTKAAPVRLTAEKEEVKEEVKEVKEESGFTVVRRGAVVGTVLEKCRPAPVADLFGESTEEEENGDVQLAAALAVEDDLAWEGLSQEEIANQKLLLAYYKQQKEKKDKRKEGKRGKKQKRK